MFLSKKLFLFRFGILLLYNLSLLLMSDKWESVKTEFEQSKAARKLSGEIDL
jgi:hypothetical protein